ncbi:glycogen synthase GlgA [Vagococcus carniphilus]|uniref:glycogen synthase GlgA n=1 Tax=Vagococcus carniphilus TaxID=218144 RepID=UPI00288E3F17|nr:glycogen synthase GlgA [Vagococcus carniphilus]MDT2848405.1 glycogen synthase GlgA [Vagococcus carniphilus]MDT2864923.1 glycogen synthase GlgA [Vagococcus carniphilus]
MKVLFCTSEASPFFKTGGLGDVAGALPKELKRQGIDVRVVLPYFSKISEEFKNQCEDIYQFTVNVGWRKQYCGIKYLHHDSIEYYFIDNEYYFNRANIYGDYDDGEKFAFFQQAIIEMMEKIDFIPDVMHLNDHHTAMIPYLLTEKYNWIEVYSSIKTILTIHNLEFQGQYGRDILPEVFGMTPERFDDGTIRFNDAVNFMKAGILYADKVTTVSPNYANEIQTPAFGFGLDPILRMISYKLTGILNGIDYDVYNPETDQRLSHQYNVDTLELKKLNKAELQEQLGLPVREDVPLIGMVSRLTYQKGFHILLAELDNLLQFDVQVVLLGTGDPMFEHQFSHFGYLYPEKTSMNISFDETLAQQIYAGSDLFLMPSASEPCGLSQMMSMRYGTLPIVHEVGGLKDSVMPFNPVTGEGTGFGFSNFQPYFLMEVIKKGIFLFKDDKVAFESLMKQAMRKDFSWGHSCEQYIALYNDII